MLSHKATALRSVLRRPFSDVAAWSTKRAMNRIWQGAARKWSLCGNNGAIEQKRAYTCVTRVKAVSSAATAVHQANSNNHSKQVPAGPSWLKRNTSDVFVKFRVRISAGTQALDYFVVLFSLAMQMQYLSCHTAHCTPVFLLPQIFPAAHFTHGAVTGVLFGSLGANGLRRRRSKTRGIITQPDRFINPLTPNDHYSGRFAPLTSKLCILYIYSTNIGTAYFKYGI